MKLKPITAKWWLQGWNPTFIQQMRAKHPQHMEAPTTAPCQRQPASTRCWQTHVLQHPFFENNLLSPQGTNALKDGEKQSEVWKQELQITKFYHRNKPPGQPSAGQNHRKQSILSQFKTPKIKLANWVWAAKFSQAAMATFFFPWQFHRQIFWQTPNLIKLGAEYLVQWYSEFLQKKNSVFLVSLPGFNSRDQ